MLSVYVPRGSSLDRIEVASDGDIPENAVWFDLFQPTLAEDKLLERHLGIAVPTREEMQEIEITSRLYVENGARYMTATLMCQSDTDQPKTTAVTFILSGHRLVTVRYDEPRPFMIVGNKLARVCPAGITGESVLMELLDAVIDRAADMLSALKFANAGQVCVSVQRVYAARGVAQRAEHGGRSRRFSGQSGGRRPAPGGTTRPDTHGAPPRRTRSTQSRLGRGDRRSAGFRRGRVCPLAGGTGRTGRMKLLARRIRPYAEYAPLVAFLVILLATRGKGYLPAETSADKFHGVGRFNVVTGAQETSADRKSVV